MSEGTVTEAEQAWKMLSESAVAARLGGITSESSDVVDDADITEGQINPHATGRTAGQRGGPGAMPPMMMGGAGGASGAQAGAAQAGVAQSSAQANAAQAGVAQSSAQAGAMQSSAQAGIGQSGAVQAGAAQAGAAQSGANTLPAGLGATGPAGVGGVGTGAAGTSSVAAGVAGTSGVAAGAHGAPPGGVIAAGGTNPDGTPSGLYSGTGAPERTAGGDAVAGTHGAGGQRVDGYAVEPEHLRRAATGWQAIAHIMGEADQEMQIPHDLGFANVAQGPTNELSQLTKLYAQQASNEFVAIDRRLHGAAGEYDERELNNARLASEAGRASE